MKEPNTQQVVVRMPTSLHQAMKAHAKANERTMAQEIRWALRQSLAQPTSPAAEPAPPVDCFATTKSIPMGSQEVHLVTCVRPYGHPGDHGGVLAGGTIYWPNEHGHH